jgi:hypothetical protein
LPIDIAIAVEVARRGLLRGRYPQQKDRRGAQFSGVNEKF